MCRDHVVIVVRRPGRAVLSVYQMHSVCCVLSISLCMGPALNMQIQGKEASTLKAASIQRALMSKCMN